MAFIDVPDKRKMAAAATVSVEAGQIVYDGAATSGRFLAARSAPQRSFLRRAPEQIAVLLGTPVAEAFGALASGLPDVHAPALIEWSRTARATQCVQWAVLLAWGCLLDIIEDRDAVMQLCARGLAPGIAFGPLEEADDVAELDYCLYLLYVYSLEHVDELVDAIGAVCAVGAAARGGVDWFAHREEEGDGKEEKVCATRAQTAFWGFSALNQRMVEPTQRMTEIMARGLLPDPFAEIPRGVTTVCIPLCFEGFDRKRLQLSRGAARILVERTSDDNVYVNVECDGVQLRWTGLGAWTYTYVPDAAAAAAPFEYCRAAPTRGAGVVIPDAGRQRRWLITIVMEAHRSR